MAPGIRRHAVNAQTRTSPVALWEHLWFRDVPPYVYALLRIAFGIVGCATLVGLHNVSQFWSLSGLVAASDAGLGIKAPLLARGLGDIAGLFVYAGCLAAFVAMAVGYATNVSVACSLIASLFQLSWNYLPLSGAHQAMQAFLFCLIWADCGAVWSLDAWLANRGRPVPDAPNVAIAPLLLIRVQVAVIYLSTGCWKLMNPTWRDGSAVWFAVNNNAFQRFPGGIPEVLAWLVPVATYTTLFWELAFAPMVLFRATRRWALWGGVAIHLSMLALIEIGPFHLVMLSSYLAFLDPERTMRWCHQVTGRLLPGPVSR